MTKHLFIILLVLCSLSCASDIYRPIPEGEHASLSFENNSTITIYIADRYFNGPYSKHRNEYYPFQLSERHCRVDPGTTKNDVDSVAGYSYEELFTRINYYTIYVLPRYYDNDNSWMSDLLVQYDLTLEDLYSLDFHLAYPPDERMKSVKMEPSYEFFINQSKN